MKHLLTSAMMLIVMAASLGAQEVPRAGDPCSQWGPRQEPGRVQPEDVEPRQDDSDAPKPANFVEIPIACRVRNDVHGPRGKNDGCCGWAALETLLLEAGYTEFAGMTHRDRRGEVMDNGHNSQIDRWLDEHKIEYDVVHCGRPHKYDFLKAHVPCLVMFDCAASNYGATDDDDGCDIECNGRFWHKPQPWGGPRFQTPAGHVAVVCGADDSMVCMVPNRHKDISGVQNINQQDFDHRWFGYCLCLRRRHKPDVQPPAPSPGPVAPAPPAPSPVEPNVTIINQISQTLDAKLDPILKRLDALEKVQKDTEKIVVIYSPPK